MGTLTTWVSWGSSGACSQTLLRDQIGESAELHPRKGRVGGNFQWVGIEPAGVRWVFHDRVPWNLANTRSQELANKGKETMIDLSTWVSRKSFYWTWKGIKRNFQLDSEASKSFPISQDWRPKGGVFQWVFEFQGGNFFEIANSFFFNLAPFFLPPASTNFWLMNHLEDGREEL